MSIRETKNLKFNGEKKLLVLKDKKINAWPCKRACELKLREACLKDTQWHEHRSLQPTLLPLGHSAYTSINLSNLPFFLSLSPYFPFICISSKPRNAMLYPQSGQHYLQFASDASLFHNTEPIMYFGLHCGSTEHKQPLAPRAENYSSHSILLASIMTLANQMQRIVMFLQTTVLRTGEWFPLINAQS